MIDLEGGKSALYQWDVNQRLVLTDVDVDEVHYFCSNYKDDNCPVIKTYKENDILYADIPNILLQKNGIITVYIYVEEENEAYTKYSAEILVLPREKPADYVYTETEIYSFEFLERRIDEVEKNSLSDERIASAVETYLRENPIDVGVQFETDKTLSLKDGILSVNTADAAEQDNTLPITSAAVHSAVGNIEILLKTI